ncbi:Uncharacterized protein BP5553_02985 [Venustampulla echinocandica]|uniref:Uncharacterized protein n=1 Tax=Venustampulla echinocandica TaxID=2656787 RepID=A0A370TSY2_9HELO|nr:Uncharacterized protein BP5553_02985 [Venustampulla echinocandica]RDL38645.1 Uncharacterized protein BP5553_02985 [Venustampulla echinocandica]
MLSSREDFSYALYQYTPQIAPAIIAAALFVLVEALGYGGRIWSHFDPTGLPGYIIQSLLILIAPALFAASIYMVLGRIIALVGGETHSWIKLKWLTKIFVIGDCISFVVQGGGGGIQAGGTLDLLHLGEKIIVAGLFIQIFFFGVFITSAISFHLCIRSQPTRLSGLARIPWQSHMAILYTTSGIILVRSIFRVVEYLMGNNGFILRHEVMLYIFDSILMIAVVALFIWRHPGTLFLTSSKRGSWGRTSGAEFDLLENR